MNMVAISDSMSIAVYAQNVENATKNSLSNNTASQSNRTSESIPPIDNLIIDHAGGTFTSLQTDKDNRTWIATGDWDLIENPLRANQSNSSSVSFNATIGLRGQITLRA